MKIKTTFIVMDNQNKVNLVGNDIINDVVEKLLVREISKT